MGGADGPRARAALECAGDTLYTLIAALLAWRLTLGGLDLRTYQESTMVLRVPLWWAFVPATACLVLLTAVCAYTAARGARAALRPGGRA